MQLTDLLVGILAVAMSKPLVTVEKKSCKYMDCVRSDTYQYRQTLLITGRDP